MRLWEDGQFAQSDPQVKRLLLRLASVIPVIDKEVNQIQEGIWNEKHGGLGKG